MNGDAVNLQRIQSRRSHSHSDESDTSTVTAPQVRVIVAVVNPVLRDALLSALAPLQCSPKVMSPEALVVEELSGWNHILLETSDDVKRLVSTARLLWEKWGETGRARLQFLSYSTPDATPDSVVFRLWAI